MAAISDPRSSYRSVSTRIQPVSTGMVRRVARVTTPVRPIPPTVAQNRSGSCVGLTTWLSPSGVTSSADTTLAPNVPSRWWLLPWTSQARAPPTVT
jgi:hypothetical protein